MTATRPSAFRRALLELGRIAPALACGALLAVALVARSADQTTTARPVTARPPLEAVPVSPMSKNLQAKMSFTLEVASVAQLKRALLLVRDVRGVLSATRR